MRKIGKMARTFLCLLLVLMLSMSGVAEGMLAEDVTNDVAEPSAAVATEAPVAEPTEEPAAEATEEPGTEETEEPVVEPTEEPVAEPTEEPAAEPTEEPVAEPIEEPVAADANQAVDNAVLQAEADGWGTDGQGNRYYVRGGERVKNQVAQIDGSFYGFDANGILFTNAAFGFYSSALGRDVYYRAKADGKLFVNEWMDRFYYGEGGQGACGITTVNGTVYYFDYDGELSGHVGPEIIDGRAYLIDAGVVRADMGAGDGWKDCDGRYYYVKNGAFVSGTILEINGNRYGFRKDTDGSLYDCAMYDAEEFSLTVTDTSGNVWKPIYRAKAGGALYTNAWGRYEGNTVYFGADGAAVTGLQTIGGKYYYFDSDCVQVRNRCVIAGGDNYYFDVSGVGTRLGAAEGWHQVGEKWCYVKNGTLVSNQVVQINGKYYGFGSDCFMMDNCAFYLDGYYRAKAGGALYTYEWYQDGSIWYFYDTNAAAGNGIAKVNGVLYYFAQDGEMLTNCCAVHNGVNYIVDGNGVARDVGRADGWKSVGYYWYYISNGVLLKDQVAQINGSYYVFDGMGHMYDDQAFWFGENYYLAKSGGYLYVNQLVENNSGKHYFGANGAAARNALVTVNGTTYYFDDTCRAATNTYFTLDGVAYYAGDTGACTRLTEGLYRDKVSGRYAYILNGSFLRSESAGDYAVYEIAGKKYAFSHDGWMLSDAVMELRVNGRYGWYLISSDGSLYTTPGWKTFNGSWYYVMEDGSLFVGVLEQNGTLNFMEPAMKKFGNDAAIGSGYAVDTIYSIASSGVLTEARADGFYRVRLGSGYDVVCYMSGGAVVKNDWRVVDGFSYYFDADGWRVEGLWEVDGKRYFFGTDGRMQKNTFVGENDCYYATSDGTLASGLITVDGKKYYFDEEENTKCFGVVNYDGGLHAFDSEDGHWVGDLTKDGWNLYNGEYYYLMGGSYLHDETAMINGALYAFDSNGVMYKNEVAYMDDGFAYIMGASGAAQSGWVLFDGYYYYGNAKTFELARSGEYLINKAIYRFDDDCRMVTGNYTENGVLYYYNASGARTVQRNLINGWNYINGECFYYKNDRAYTGWVGNYYVGDGWMFRDGIFGVDGRDYYFDVRGVVSKNQWIDGMYYAKASGVLAKNEWLTIGGATYFFDGYEKVSGYCEIDGCVYLFDDSGRYQGAVDSLMKSNTDKDGWVTRNGKQYYSLDGYYLHGKLAKVEGNYYLFDLNGAVLTDVFANPKGDCGYRGTYYFASNGRMKTSGGWQKFNGRWCYFNGDGRAYDGGWHFIDGKKYYFVRMDYNDSYPAAAVIGYQTINNRIYYFDSDGALDPSRSPAMSDGWYLLGSDWYYYRDGKTISGGISRINGTTYGFDANGRMVTNWVVSSGADRYCTNGSGVVVTTQGRRQVSGRWVYVGIGGKLYANGLYKIDGVDYAFDSYGFLIG